jgi:hypothetical protein
MDKHLNQQNSDLEQNQQPQGNRPPGIATVNGSDSQTPDEREAYIANEPDTKRLHSERGSVEENRNNNE